MAMPKGLAEIKRRWVEVTPGRQEEYEKGVTTPEKDWHEETVKAEPLWLAAIRDAKVQKRHADRVAATPTKKWKDKTLAKAARWGEGVRGAADAYEAGMKPFVEGWDAGKLKPKAGKRDWVPMLARIESNLRQFGAIKDALA